MKFSFRRAGDTFRCLLLIDSSSITDAKASDSPNFRLRTLRDKDLCLPQLLKGVSEL
jgi:hypothetical protein